ncbi:MAG: methylmalonyl-CoA epimerase [Euryarchaeota archaeon]|nr:methylmalonyl-CoA epimerase [Euryarchaeota archaeon]|tara:strand:+ start:222 stop:653 length:432 start_codon:yes stop_codon:yes gene_type:complete
MPYGPITLDHIGIAAPDLEAATPFWTLLGLAQGEHDETVEDQGVVTRFFSTDKQNGRHPARIELLEPTAEDTPIGRFLERRGAGVQQVCFRVGDLEGLIQHLLDHGVRMIDEVPRKGAGGMRIAFVHPKSTGGVLVELASKGD